MRAADGYTWPGDNCSASVDLSTLGRVFFVTVQVDTRYGSFTEQISNDQFLIVSGGALHQFVPNCA